MYLRQQHDATSVAVILGIAASHISSMEAMGTLLEGTRLAEHCWSRSRLLIRQFALSLKLCS